MKYSAIVSVTMGLLLVSSPASSEGMLDSQPSTSDQRQLVTMPDQSRELMRQDMLGHLSALTEILGYLAEDNLNAVAEVAETKMGNSAKGKHRATGMGPGRFMPILMRNMGWTMHEMASELSLVAKRGDIKQSYAALQKLIASCATCHFNYRTQ